MVLLFIHTETVGVFLIVFCIIQKSCLRGLGSTVFHTGTSSHLVGMFSYM